MQLVDKRPLRQKKKTKAVRTTFTFIDLFAGIGGFHSALHDLGGNCVFASEWDVYARRTYEENYKKISPKLFSEGRFFGDITQITNTSESIKKNIPKFDILCAGFPCQPFSQAGFKKGFSETRGTLFYDIVKIIEARQPKAFFLENVRHLRNHDEGRTFEIIKDTIENELGYSFKSKIVKASDFGLPQHRPRLFMVGFKKKEIDFEFPEPIELKMTMSDIFGGKCDRRIGFTLRCGGRTSPITDRRNWDGYMVNGKLRRIGEEEGIRMMGLPKTFKFPDDVPHTQSMKQLGNSVAVAAVRATAEKMLVAMGYYA